MKLLHLPMAAIQKKNNNNNNQNWSNGTSQSAWKRTPATITGILLCMLEHEVDLFGEGDLVFVSGTKLRERLP
jgi:hypothetical protein